MYSSRRALTTLLALSTGCGAPKLAPSASRLDLAQAARLDGDQNQVGLGAGDFNAGITARRTFGMDRDVGGDVGLWSSVYYSSFDGGVWLPASERTALRIGAMGGLGQSGVSGSANEVAPAAGFSDPVFAGLSFHAQHLLGLKRKDRRTAWSITHGYGFTSYLPNTLDDNLLSSVAIDASVRADFNAKEDHGAYTTFGVGAIWVIPNLTLRAGYRF